MSDDDLLADPERMPGVKYRLQIAVEGAIDAAEHVIASNGWSAPETFAEAFAILGENGVLSDDLAGRLQDAARFRNLLVHGYAVVDDDRVREILRTRLDDLEAFRRSLAQLTISDD